jgi:hypothetical protein
LTGKYQKSASMDVTSRCLGESFRVPPFPGRKPSEIHSGFSNTRQGTAGGKAKAATCNLKPPPQLQRLAECIGIKSR